MIPHIEDNSNALFETSTVVFRSFFIVVSSCFAKFANRLALKTYVANGLSPPLIFQQ